MTRSCAPWVQAESICGMLPSCVNILTIVAFPGSWGLSSSGRASPADGRIKAFRFKAVLSKPKLPDVFGGLEGPGRKILRCSESFFDNSKVRLHCKSKTRPSGSNSWIYNRFAVLRIVSEKILIRAQGSLPGPVIGTRAISLCSPARQPQPSISRKASSRVWVCPGE
jgi:hypothetical protein